MLSFTEIISAFCLLSVNTQNALAKVLIPNLLPMTFSFEALETGSFKEELARQEAV